jgi:hypothetical protein
MTILLCDGAAIGYMLTLVLCVYGFSLFLWGLSVAGQQGWHVSSGLPLHNGTVRGPWVLFYLRDSMPISHVDQPGNEPRFQVVAGVGNAQHTTDTRSDSHRWAYDIPSVLAKIRGKGGLNG